jgi:hypothetical protein
MKRPIGSRCDDLLVSGDQLEKRYGNDGWLDAGSAAGIP